MINVMMLGWEYPPRFAGGLGKACQGLSSAIARRGVNVKFVLPSFPKALMEPGLEVIGARERVELSETMKRALKRARVDGAGDFTVASAGVNLFPYGKMVDEPVEAEMRPVTHPRTAAMLSYVGGPPEVEVKAKPVQDAIYGKNLWSDIREYSWAVRKLGASATPDLVHAHDWMTFPAAFEVQRVKRGTPVFLHVHATEFDRSGTNMNHDIYQIEKEGFRKATHIFTVSRYTAEILQRHYGVSPSKISVIYNAPEEEDEPKEIKLEETKDDIVGAPIPVALKSEPSVAPRKHHVVFLGRLTFQKGPDHFLRSCAMVAKADENAEFVFCGTGDMQEALKRQAWDLGIGHRVHFSGFLDPPKVKQVLQSSKVLVMPSVSEPFGLVALEAIRCGLPVIMSKQSGVREVLSRGLIVDFWDTEKLADQILASLRLPDLSRQLVEEGLFQVRQLSWDRSADRVVDVYRKYSA